MPDQKTIPFLMYHRVATAPPASNVPGHYVPVSRFRAHMRALQRKGYLSISLDQFAKNDFPTDKKSVVLTFDDGYEHWDKGALAVLREMNWRAILFVVGGRMGGSNTWDNQQGDVVEFIADAEMVKKWSEEGFEIGDHSFSHRDLTATNDEELREQISCSRQALLEATGKEPRWFCYPYGRQDERVREFVRQAGYSGACSTRKGLNDSQTDCFQWRRINVRSDTWTPVLFWKLKREERRHIGEA